MIPRRARRILGIWLAALAAELVLWWFFVRSSYFKELFMPITVMVVIAAVAGSAGVMRGRQGERREGDRRGGERRD